MDVILNDRLPLYCDQWTKWVCLLRHIQEHSSTTWHCEVCTKARSKEFKNGREKMLWRGTEAYERMLGYRHYRYVYIYQYRNVDLHAGSVDDQISYYRNTFLPSLEGPVTFTDERFMEEKVCKECWSMFRANRPLIFDDRSDTLIDKLYDWKRVLRGIRSGRKEY